MARIMSVPVIKVRDKSSGHIHMLGTDSHDTLHINEHGSLDYLNLQCCEGTGKHGCYEFVGEGNEYSPYVEVEFVPLEDFLKLCAKELEISAEQEKHFREVFAPSMQKYLDELEEPKQSGLWHS